MSTKNGISKALSMVLPAGAVGASFLLALSSAQAASPPDPTATAFSHRPGVASRLEAIRAGVTQMGNGTTDGANQVDQSNEGALIPTWWGNGGWGRWHAGWGNGGWGFGWHNGGWGNGGWGNGGWRNGGWGNAAWGNGGWHNNWNNGWHNYWHNN
jgi:rSAM-associated Gly-rich repeat protein